MVMVKALKHFCLSLVLSRHKHCAQQGGDEAEQRNNCLLYLFVPVVAGTGCMPVNGMYVSGLHLRDMYTQSKGHLVELQLVYSLFMSTLEELDLF